LAANAALGRTVGVDEVAQAVVFLSGERASAITGVNLPVDCGWLAAASWVSHGGLRGPDGANA
jgi:enoyl-[acyl-carrier-protein] reductase (NADH)